MKARNTQSNKPEIKSIKTTRGDQTVEVLYQRMGDRWFAFSCIDDEVFVGSITAEELHALEEQAAGNKQKLYKITGNS